MRDGGDRPPASNRVIERDLDPAVATGSRSNIAWMLQRDLDRAPTHGHRSSTLRCSADHSSSPSSSSLPVRAI
jgi:hypothetical protein